MVSPWIVEPDAVVAEAQAELGRLDILEPLHIAFLTDQKSCQPVQEIESGLAVDSAKIGAGLIGPGDLLSHFL